jgi:hypothetical protein
MLRHGAIVTLEQDKSHGEGNNALHIESGISGMVVEYRPGPDREPIYVVDFGPQGQWNCTRDELKPEREEDDWNDPQPEERQEFRMEWTQEFGGNEPEEDDESDEEEVQISDRLRIPDPPRPSNPILRPGYMEDKKESGSNKIDFDKDMERMMKQIEKEKGGRK